MCNKFKCIITSELCIVANFKKILFILPLIVIDLLNKYLIIKKNQHTTVSFKVNTKTLKKVHLIFLTLITKTA